ncbi:hypothetical protein [Natrialba asiatica]|uniref:DUF8048 domain-containing protein n=1 Tax=Natrialba asiatica (strain ATCC 700177 / DSM 12278 / JCM 9576 / FERM P-10747 / NBRC 102637 / 172P1) TaxID=29540 RepID=M0AMS4_NATA1|nr:hypothetical protein [Natrialba asiatica]ELY99227.1 hypothetical protein C481_15290 [Natrialba asiatica DSM 12278]
MSADPIDGQVLLLTAAKASVPPTRLPELVDDAQTHLANRLERYRHEFERLYADEFIEAFLVEWGHWADLGAELGMSEREIAAVRRAHEEQVLRAGRRMDREGEFETAFEIREAVCIGVKSECESDPE